MSHKSASHASTTPNLERDRHAFNLAFSELDLDWHWDEQTYSELQSIAAEDDRVRAYLKMRHGHLLKAYDEEFLIDAIRQTKARISS